MALLTVNIKNSEYLQYLLILKKLLSTFIFNARSKFSLRSIRLLTYFIVSFSIYLIYLWGWFKVSGAPEHGLYSSTDGNLAAWYTKFLVDWSTPFSMSVINPFQGSVSLFFPNSPWFNPGALALSLPFSKVTTYLISYTIYWFELLFSLYFLSRTFQLSRFSSFLIAFVYLLFLFPPFSGYFSSLSFLSLAPFNAHLVSLNNILLMLYIKVGNTCRVRENLRLIVLMLLCATMAIISAPVTCLTYLPAYGIIGLGATFGNKKSAILWKLASVITIVMIFLLLGIHQYFKGTSLISTGSIDLGKSSFNFPENFYFDPCYYQSTGLFCTKNKISILHLSGLVCALFGMILFSKKHRGLAIAFCFAALLPEFLSFMVYNNAIHGPLAQLHTMFITWSVYPFYCIMLGLAWNAMSNLDLFNRILNWVQAKVGSRLPYSLAFLGLFLILFYLGTIIARTPAYYVESQKSPIIGYLEEKIALKTGGTFRGSVITYIGSQNSSLRNVIDPKNVKENNHFAIYYTLGRDLLLASHGSMHMYSDLWKFNIPSLEEYGQWITYPLFSFFHQFLANPTDGHYRNYLNVYKLDFKILAALGTQYIISDKPLKNEKIDWVLTQPPQNANYIKGKFECPLYLYKIKNANCASYSPIKLTKLNSIDKIYERLAHKTFSFEHEMIIQEDVNQVLTKAINTSMQFHRNEIHVQAEAPGWSVILLPVQYSHCYTLEDRGGSENEPRFIRANLVQSAIVFKDKTDVRLRFKFGFGQHSGCRLDDIAELHALGLDAAKLNIKMDPRLQAMKKLTKKSSGHTPE